MDKTLPHKRSRAHGPSIIASLLCLVLCATVLAPAPCHGISIEKETELGKKFLASIKGHFVFLDDDFAQDYINRLGKALSQNIDTKPFPFHYYIVKQNQLNAFAGPGGHIFIFSGLISSLENADELAGVLAHEMGHVAARHLSQRIEQNKKINVATMAAILTGIFVGGKAAAALTTGSVAAGIQAQLHYSREDERQADQLGFKYASLAGFAPSGLIHALTVIQKNSWMESNKIPPYLRTHPTGPERIANLESMLNKFPPHVTDEARILKKQFPVFKTIVEAKCNNPIEMQEVFTRSLQKGKNIYLSHLGLGIIYKAKSQYRDSIKHLKEALIGMPSSPVVWMELAEAYQLTGEDRKALPLFEKILKQRPNDKRATFLMAESYENLGEYNKAIILLERLLFSKHVNPEVYYHLGMSYGRLKRLALAHYNFGRYFKALGRREKARFHFLEAKRLSQGNPSLQQKIQDASKGIL